MNRRRFFQTTAASTLAIPAFALEADNAFRKSIGIQLYTLRNQIKADVAGTIKAVAEAGYKQVEPYGFPDADEMIAASKDNDLEVNSSHFAWESVTDPEKEGVPAFTEILGKAKSAGLSHLVIPYIHGHNRKTLDDYKRLAERCNKAAAEAKTAGIQLAYHNHNFEFEPKEGGKSGYDIFIAEFAPEMQFEVDVFWVRAAGVNPVDLIRKLKGRVSQLHLKDLKTGSKTPNFGGVANDDFEELGDGMIPMEPIIEIAAEAGVKICHVEQDQSPDPLASIRKSLDYLKTL
ncbi:MAG: sugar phosphate isomerase/epimerase [Verrucomicrobiales bacterium]|jgi:sugar phosphate isomerase/epimerase